MRARSTNEGQNGPGGVGQTSKKCKTEHVQYTQAGTKGRGLVMAQAGPSNQESRVGQAGIMALKQLDTVAKAPAAGLMTSASAGMHCLRLGRLYALGWMALMKAGDLAAADGHHGECS